VCNKMNNNYIRVAKRMMYEQLIKGHKDEAELKRKDDKHVDAVLKYFDIKIEKVKGGCNV